MRTAMIGAAVAAAVLLGSSTDDPRIVFRGDPSKLGFGTVILRGLPDEAILTIDSAETAWKSLFPVYVGDFPGVGEEKPPVLGRYTIEEGLVRFSPRLPFVAGMSYSARFRGGSARGIPELELTFTMPTPEGMSPTRVEAIYPSGNEVPANLLRLYVHFTAPMLPKNVLQHIRLHDEATGDEVPLAFVDIQSGLWDPGYRRLTLLVHPGRVKRGVAPGDLMGPVLLEGRRYRLVIDAGMPDVNGRALDRTYEKRFRAGRSDRSSSDPSSWKVSPPASPGGSVRLDIPDPIDHALLKRLITVRAESGEIVAGDITISKGETR